MPNVEDLVNSPPPVAVTMDAQEIGVFYASNLSPVEFNQMLMAKFKDAGAPVEGTLHLRFAHGQMYKLKSQPGEMEFTYLWLGEAYVDGLAALGGVN